jgi:hypothetical protein
MSETMRVSLLIAIYMKGLLAHVVPTNLYMFGKTR